MRLRRRSFNRRPCAAAAAAYLQAQNSPVLCRWFPKRGKYRRRPQHKPPFTTATAAVITNSNPTTHPREIKYLAPTRTKDLTCFAITRAYRPRPLTPNQALTTRLLV